jgi:DNA-binding CsgD family transcriptional regulator
VSASSPIDVVEAAYCVGHARDAWLRGVLEAAEPLLHPWSFPTGYFIDPVGSPGAPVHGVQVLGAPRSVADAMAAFHNKREHDTLRAILHPPGFRTMLGSDFVPSAGLQSQYAEFIECFAEAGIRIGDTMGVLAIEPSGRGVSLSCVFDRATTLSRSARLRWTRVAVHIAAGSRLRGALTQTRAEPQPDAVLSPSGQIEHAEGDAKQWAALESLRARAVTIDRARSRKGRSDPDAALEAWQGLVSGRWSLVDRFESDGRRYVVAHRNEPRTARILALTPREEQVVSHLLLGHSSKLTAYTLGISPAAVSAALKSSMQKLGVRSAAQLLHRLSGMRETTPAGAKTEGDAWRDERRRGPGPAT